MKLLRTAFEQDLAPAVSSFLSSINDDESLTAADITGSVAHTTMLAHTGLITQEQSNKIVNGLHLLQDMHSKDVLQLDPVLEDVHMNIEAKLQEIIGPDAKHLHTARSRNDQVALDLRLYVIEQINIIGKAIGTLQESLIDISEQNLDVVMPGYTHMQRAQPVSFAHAMLAYVAMFERDLSRFIHAKQMSSVSPLGAGAIAGTSLPILPEFTTSLLGFTDSFSNSIDAVCDRDFAADFLYASVLTSIHLSQLSETLIIWTTDEFGFIKFPDSLTTTSSLMPQKKNPDPLELIRGKTGSVIGELVNLLVTLKALPLGYNRDLQETKPPVIHVSETLKAALEVMSLVVQNIQIAKSRTLQAASDPNLMATDLVEYLVKKSVPFRQAHEIVASLVKYSREQKKLLSALTIEEFKHFAPQLDEDVYALFDPVQSVNNKTSPGGTSPAQVAAAIEVARGKLPSIPSQLPVR